MLKNHYLKQFNNILLLIGSFLAASCANQNTSSNMVSAIQSTANERVALTKPPKQVLVGKWFVADGTQFTLYADGNFDSNGVGVSSSGDKNIPSGMFMQKGLLVAGKLRWEYDGNNSEGFLKFTVDNYSNSLSASFLSKISFVNERKIIAITLGKTEVLAKIN